MLDVPSLIEFIKRMETINLWKIHSVWEVFFEWCSLSRGSSRSYVKDGPLTRGTVFPYSEIHQVHKPRRACVERWSWLQKCGGSLGDGGGSPQPKEEEVSRQGWCPRRAGEPRLWSAPGAAALSDGRQLRTGGGAEKRQRCHVSSVTLISPSLFNVLVNQDLDQNREFSGAVKIFSQILPFAWPGELKERSSRGAPKWFCRTPFSRMVSSANESLPLFHKMGINKPSAIRIMFFKAVGWKTLYKSKASFWYMCFGLNVRITTGGERLLTDVSQQNSPIYLFPR